MSAYPKTQTGGFIKGSKIDDFAGEAAKIIVGVAGNFAAALHLRDLVAVQGIAVGVAGLGGAGGSGIDQGGEKVGLVVGVDAADAVGIIDAGAGAVGVVGIGEGSPGCAVVAHPGLWAPKRTTYSNVIGRKNENILCSLKSFFAFALTTNSGDL